MTMLRAAAIACAFLFALEAPAWALTFTWTGGGADNKWTTDANWAGNQSPADVQGQLHTLVFPAGVQKTLMENDLPPSFRLRSLQFQAPYVVSGNSIRLEDGIVVSYSGDQATSLFTPIILDLGGVGGTVTMNVTATLALNGAIGGPANAGFRKEGVGTLTLTNDNNNYEGSTVVAEGILEIWDPLSLGAPAAFTTVGTGATLRIADNNLTVPEPIAIAGQGPTGSGGALVFAGENCVVTQLLLGTADGGVFVHNGRTARIDGAITGSGGLVKRGPGTLILSGGANTYTGLTTNNGGTLVLQKNSAVAVPAGLLINAGTVRLDRSFAIAGEVTIDEFGTLNLNNRDDTISALNGRGGLMLGTGDLVVETNGENSVFSGPISGSGRLIKIGTASLTLRGISSAFTGSLLDLQGPVHLDGTVAGPVQVQGSLRGNGATGPLTAQSGTVEPGGIVFPFLRTQSVKLQANSTLHIGPHAPSGSASTQLRVTGTVTIENASLTVLGSGSPVQGDEFVIIDNDGSDPVTGTFKVLPEGTVFTHGGRTFRISYAGGDGNDVVLTALVMQHHLSEGATGTFFDTDLLIANPNNDVAPIDVRFLKPGGQTVLQSYTVPAMSRMTIRVDDVPGLESTEVSTIVTSVDALPLVVERTMRWDANGYGAHTEKAVGGPSETWYFAEGSQGFFSTYLLLANPNAGANQATVEYLREGTTPIVRTYPLDPFARLTVDIGADPDLVGQSFGMTVTFALPGVAERSMYFGQSPLWNAGHESAGVTTPSRSWFLAEGATGGFFETFVLLANPGTDPADATLTFLPESGLPVTKTKTIPARGRLTVNIEAEDDTLANAAVATSIDATHPIVVERAQYWPDPAPQWYEAHNSFGLTESADSWGFAEGRVGGPAGYQTYILLANPGDSKSADVTLTFLREGKPSFTKTFTVNPSSRFTVSTGPGSLVPELQDEYFGVKITATEPIVAERAMYSNAGGVVWSAGTNATATRLP